MHIEQLREFALSLEGVEESCPFGPDVLVYKVADRMFLLIPLNTDQLRFNAKCDPDRAIELRMQYPDSVLPGYHMNKQHWNTVLVDGRLSDLQLEEMVISSYHLIKSARAKKNTKKK
jgi:predicted DNA-binding protein (MmcQ/YjbR family)